MNDKKINDIRKKRYLENIKLFSKFGHGKSQAYIYLVATFASLSILILFAIGPTLGTITELQKKLEDSKMAYAALETKIQNLNVLRQQYASIASDLPLITNALPIDPTATSLLGRIQAAAAQSNVTVETVSATEIPILATSPGTEAFFDFSITASGNYDNLIGFFDTIAKFDRVISVSAFSVSRDTTSETPTQARTLTIEGSAYYQ